MPQQGRHNGFPLDEQDLASNFFRGTRPNPLRSIEEHCESEETKPGQDDLYGIFAVEEKLDKIISLLGGDESQIKTYTIQGMEDFIANKRQ